MTTRYSNYILAMLVVSGVTSSVVASDAPPPAPAYGSQLMTPQERVEQRDKMRTATTKEERDTIRAQHHDQMQARAKEQGVALPDAPPNQGGGMGRQMGQGAGMGGMGPGGGMGMGRGRNR